MARKSKKTQPVSTGAKPQDEPAPTLLQTAAGTAVAGKTGEGSRSALAQLLSQEQARIVPRTEDSPNGPASTA